MSRRMYINITAAAAAAAAVIAAVMTSRSRLWIIQQARDYLRDQ